MSVSDSDADSNADAVMDTPEDSALMSPMLMGEKILNKKAVYEPSSSQRCKQMVCNRWWTIAILAMIGAFILLIAIVAAFARPGSFLCQTLNGGDQQTGEQLPDVQTTLAPVKDYISTDGSPFPWRDIHLPRTVLPDHYDLFLHPNISRSVFSGHVRIHSSVVTATDSIVFHVLELNISKVEVLRGEVKVGVARTLEYKANQQFYIGLKQTLTAGSKIVIVVEFQAKLINKLAGFYKSAYTTVAGEKREIATTHFEPTDARAAFPCFDEPDLKANFTLSIVRDAQHISLFNMPLKTTSPYQGNLLKDDYQTSVKMSTYLVAFVVCDFKNITSYTKQNTMVRVFAPEDLIEQARFSLEVAVKVLDYYSEFFGLDYPLPKQDLIAIPDFAAGAMENWGLITFRTTSFLYDPNTTSPLTKQTITVTVAHELAHQWFGNIVTMTWWDDLWLNEGFAAFMEGIGGDVAEPSFQMDEQFQVLVLQRALHLDALANSHPIHVKVTDPAQINEIFDDISYDKGASIIKMLQGFLGEEVFKRGLHNYLTDHSYGNARTDDLWQSLQDASNMPRSMTVKDVMDTWTLQMGYPVVTVRPKPGTQHLLLTQHRFLLSNTSHQGDNSHFTSPFNYTWKIPVTYRTKTRQDKKLLWLKDKEMTLPVTLENNDWIKFNLETKGVYRVNYDDSLWKRIIQQLNTDHTVFSTADRTGLINDAFALARAGELSYDIVFELLGYLKKETEYTPLHTVIVEYRFIMSRMYVTDEYVKLQKYLLDLVSDRLNSLGWGQQSEPLNEYLQEALLTLSIDSGHKENIKKAQQLFDNLSSVPKNLQELVCRTSVKYGDDDVWLRVFHNYSTAHIPTEKKMLLRVLSETTDPRRTQLFLRDSLNDKIVRSQDTSTVIETTAMTDSGHIFAWRFLQQNWDKLFDRYGKTSFILNGILKSVVSPFNTQFDYDEVKAFFQTKSLGSGSRGLKQSLEMVQSHIQWTAQSQPTITQWLNSHQQT